MFGTNVDAFIALIAMALSPHAQDAGTKTKVIVAPAHSVQQRIITTRPDLNAAKVAVPGARQAPPGR